MGTITIESAAIRLTDTILGYNEQDLEETLKAIAADVGVSHIAYLRFAPDKSSDASLLSGTTTYPFQWQTRYFLKQYVLIDPTISHGSKAVLPFDWGELAARRSSGSSVFCRCGRPRCRRQRAFDSGAQSEGRLLVGVVHQQPFATGLGRFQKDQYGQVAVDLGPHRFRRERQSQTDQPSRQTVKAGRTMPDLGCKR